MENEKLLKRKEQLQNKLKPYEESLAMINLEDEFNSAVHQKLCEKISPLKKEITTINNRLLVEYNINNQYVELKRLLNQYESPVENINDFPFKNLFSKIIINSKNDIKFLIGPRHDFDNFNQKKKGLFNQTITYKIRKTNFESHYGLYFF